MGFILSPIAILLMAIVSIIHDIWMMFVNVYKRHWLQVVSERKFTKAKKIDILGNWLFGDFLNWAMSCGGYAFGRFGETISSCLGVKFLEGSLSWVGLFWYYFLYAVDFTKWKKGGHCFYAIQTAEEIENFLNHNK